MKKIDFKMLIITCIFCLLPILVGLWQYDALPDKVAIHFDVNNNPDNYFSKGLFVFALPVIMMVMQVICVVTTDLTNKYKEANKKSITVFKWIIPVVTIFMYVITLAYNLGMGLDIRVWVMLLLGAMFIVVGNYIPKTVGTFNYPMNKLSENVQKRINKISGYVLIAYGILFIISVFFQPIVSVILVIFIIIDAIVLCIYSLKLEKDEKKKEK